MKSVQRWVVVAIASVLAGAADAGTADEDYSAWIAVYRQSPPRDKADRAKVDVEAFWRNKSVELDRISRKFVRNHPDDSRRWEVMLRPIQMARWRKGDRAALEEATRRDIASLRAIIESPDVAPEIVEQAHSTLMQRSLDSAAASLHAGDVPDTRNLEAEIDRYAGKHPASRSRPLIERRFLDLLNEYDPSAARARMDRLVGDSNREVAGVAQALVEKAGYLGKRIEMKFTAADGREIDLAGLRGKVVLVDFWATWCGPCMNEMPHVKEVYAKYRDRGFEVIGVSLDGGGITKGIQSGVRTKEDFLAFLEREKMPWPQHYDNLGWKNEFAQKFAIKSIPAVFLLDRDGRVIATELRGEGFVRTVRQALEKPVL